jgi:aminomethyltransferase
MPLYGNELDRATNPYEANLGRVVKLDKGEFVGRAALAAVQQAGPRRRLVGLVMQDEAIARHGYPVLVDGQPVGSVTSGTASPSLGRNIAMAYLPAAAAEVGRAVEVVVRDRPHPAEQVKLPFYKRPRPGSGTPTPSH